MDIATVTSYTSQAKANQNNGGSGQAEWIIHLSKWFSFSSIPGRILRVCPKLINNLLGFSAWSRIKFSRLLIFQVFSCSVKSRYIPLVECLKLESRNGLMIASLSSFSPRSCFLLRSKIWWPEMDGYANIFPGINKCLSFSLCPDRGAQKIIRLAHLHVTMQQMFSYGTSWKMVDFCRGLNRMRLGNLLVLCLFLAYFQGLSLIGCGL